MKVNADGISSSRVYLPRGQEYHSLLDFFVATFPHIDRAEWLTRFSEGLVLTPDGQVVAADDAYRPDTHLLYFRRLGLEPDIPFIEEIIYQNDHILVADKPHFLPVTPGGRFLRETLLVRLKHATDIETLTPIHRLDRDTAGVMMLSVNPATRSLWQS